MPGGSPNWIIAALDRYEGPLLRYAARLVGDTDAARDIVQGCFLELCRQRRDAVEDRVAPWLFSVCRNRAIDQLRRERARAAADPACARDDATPFVPLEREQEVSLVLACMRELPARQQEVLHLKFAQGLRYREIAKVLDTSVSNVGVLIHTAIRRLRDRVEADAPVTKERRTR